MRALGGAGVLLTLTLAVLPADAAEGGVALRLRLFVESAKLKEAQGDVAGAVEDYRRAVAADPSNHRTLNMLGAALLALSRHAEAEEAARRSLETAAERNAFGYEILARAQFQQGQDAAAMESARRALEQIRDADPDSARHRADANALMAFAYERLGAAEKALLHIQEAARLHPARYGEHLRVAQAGGRFSGREGEFPSWALALVTLLAGVGGFLAWQRRAPPAPSAAPPAEPAPAEVPSGDGGLIGGKYRLTRVIGKGGMGQVWEAWDVSLERPAAMKRMSSGLGSLAPKARELYLKEARTVAALHHPNIVDIYSILDLREGLFLVFEFVAGKTIQHLLVERKRYPLGAARELLRPVCEALAFAHARGVVHRDLKPSNVMVAEAGFVKVMDFGIARRSGELAEAAGVQPPGGGAAAPGPIPVAHTQTVVGTPAYMAPEALEGIVSPASDVYSLGVCFYELCTGRLPFGDEGDISAKINRGYPRPSAVIPGLSPRVDDFVDAALDPGLQTRIPSIREFRSRLEALPDEAAVGGGP